MTTTEVNVRQVRDRSTPTERGASLFVVLRRCDRSLARSEEKADRLRLERREIMREMRDEDVPVRRIAEALGISEQAVRKDLDRVDA